MKKFLLVVMLAAGMHSLFAQVNPTVPGDSVPMSVNKAFLEKYPDVKGMAWHRTAQGYRAGFKSPDNMDQFADYDSTGKMISENLEMKKESLPASAIDYISKNLPDQQYGKIYQVTKPDGLKNYVVNVGGKWLLFDAQGSFVPSK
ncbi:MAG: hypothetical protein H0W62_08995 [Chitinophagales bacterium]|nr:hypothetical protein [Chitinophagales bacterium]